MGAYTSVTVNPLELILDKQNPRFIIPDSIKDEQAIIEYMCDNEDVVELCNDLNRIGTILPGERPIVYKERDRYVVLEGNRRVTSCKMLLDRTQIPQKYINRINTITDETKGNITAIEVDVVSSRESAAKYLAARHISGVKRWSTLAKMNVIVSQYTQKRSVDEIVETLSLSRQEINKALRNNALLQYGIEHGNWTEEERAMLSLSDLEPDRFFRIFAIRKWKDVLQVEFDSSFSPSSKAYTVFNFKKLISSFVRGAFINKTIDTRNMEAEGGSVYEIIQSIPSISIERPKQSDSSKSDGDGDGNGNENGTQPVGSTRGNGTPKPPPPKPPTNYPLFGALDCRKVKQSDPHNRGLIAVLNEIIRFSQARSLKSLPTEYPIAATMLTRALVENTFVYYLRQIKKWDEFSKGLAPDKVKLSDIVKYYNKCLSNLIHDTHVRSLFTNLFADYDKTANQMNWVVHQVRAYKLSGVQLQQMVDSGLHTIVQYMLSAPENV